MLSLPLLLAAIAAVVTAAPLPIPALPTLTFAGLDWLNVKSAPFNAKGDGKTDDTAAIQAALHIMGKNYGNNTVYFPAGTYLITKTLLINSTLGAAIYGSGATTILKWGAGRAPTAPATSLLAGTWPPAPPANISRLFWSIGNTRFTMEGFVLDGNAGECGVGFDHASYCVQGGFCGAYESGVTHRNLHFKGFFVAGIRVGSGQPPHGSDTASAEIQYTNCIFEGSRAGISLLAWNDFDNVIVGCLFANNSYGVECIAGNYYIQNTRFQYNNVTDALITAHSNSLRRVVSVGSAAFLLQTDNNCFNGAVKVVECLVSGWGSPAAPSAAILYQTRGPVMLIDSVFDSPANAASPALALRNTTWTGPDAGIPYVGYGGKWGSVVSVNSSTRGACGALLDPASTAELVAGGHFYSDFPPGDPAIAARLPPLTPSTQFFNPAWPAYNRGKVYDAVRDFGASNTGKETSRALQACIDAAGSAGGGAVCYLQDGQYSVNATLRLCGSDFVLMGSNSGFRTFVHWAGPASNDSIPLATGPAAGCAASSVTLRRLTVQTPTPPLVVSRTPTIPASYTGHDIYSKPEFQAHGEIHLPGGGAQAAPVRVVLDNFYAIGNRVVLSGLAAGDTVSGWKLDGDLEVWDSDAAVVLLSYMQVGTTGVTVARSPGAAIPSAAARAAGFCGAAVLVAACSFYDFRLYNSSSWAMGSHYTETSFASMYFEGDGASPPGTVAVDHSKLNSGWKVSGAVQPSWVAHNYAGTVFTHGATGAQDFAVRTEGAAATQVAVMGWIMQESGEVLSSGSPAVLHALGNIVSPYESGPPPYTQQAYFPDVLQPGSKAVFQAALDRLRYLGILDLQLNFPFVKY